jgi:hypothetical protein
LRIAYDTVASDKPAAAATSFNRTGTRPDSPD